MQIATAETGEKKKKSITAKGKGPIKVVFRFLIGVFLASCVFVAIFRVALTLNIIPSESMLETLKVGDIVVGSRWDRKNISRYDIVTFHPPDKPQFLYIKRVIGLPGETIEVRDGNVYADGKKLDRSFINNGEQGPSGDGIYHVPEGHYFMMGDNRDFSEDSRFWKKRYVPAESIVCKAKWIVFPFDDIRSLKH